MSLRKVYIVDGARTPCLKARGKPGEFSASDLAVSAGKSLLLRQAFLPHDLDEVIVGCMMPSENEANIARIIALRLGCGKSVPAWTVQRNCGSGMQAIDSAAQNIATGRSDLVLAGGTEAMSRGPLLWQPSMIKWLADMRMSKNLPKKLANLVRFRPQFLKPIIALMNGLSDPMVGLNMGQTAENLAHIFKITREQMDLFAMRSHQRAAHAQERGIFTEVTPLYSNTGSVYDKDDGVRPDSSMEALAKLKPVFDKFGLVTAGNSAQITDGASMLLLASESAVSYYNLPVLGVIVDTQWSALAPEEMGLGPIYASTPLLVRNHLTVSDIDYWEINEAFAGQVLACLAAWEDKEYCRHHLGLDEAMGTVDQERLNVDGGAIALGHPVGSSGARIVLHLLEVLKRSEAKRGIASLCIGGGQGGAMLVERVS